ncbi:hypothetical protein [Paraferrimonas haliotis]|uniref:hypothetical protein n=1 Tax=Paraferrimonas haliotis TaxID=2013866 RepID=UPI000BA9B950|nr:hypothetical protein [Paraferrimonas haliotis]
MHRCYLLLCALLMCAPSWSADGFYANESVQQQLPSAFALQKDSLPFLQQAQLYTQSQARDLVRQIGRSAPLKEAIEDWPKLSFEQQQPYLQQVFALQCRILGVAPPTLLIDADSYPDKLAYFDFDVDDPESGIVYLNSSKFTSNDPYLSLLLLIHETRHAYQLQRTKPGPLQQGFLAAFTAQKTLKSMSYLDFMTLNNEYEAFQFANFAVGLLTNFSYQNPKLGSYASQYYEQGILNVDLVALHAQHPKFDVINEFNRLSQAQKIRLADD